MKGVFDIYVSVHVMKKGMADISLLQSETIYSGILETILIVVNIHVLKYLDLVRIPFISFRVCL